MKIPAVGETVSPARIDRAERLFAKSLAKEAAPAARPVERKKISATAARQRGSSMGSAFAQLSGSDFDRISSHSDALRRGVAEARRDADLSREMAQDNDFLRSLGFSGKDEDDC